MGRLARIIVHDAPGGLVARIAGKFGPPQKCAPIRHLLLRPAAMAAEFDSIAVKLLCLLQMAECDVDQRQMTAQMTVEEAIRKNSPHWAWLGSFRTPVYDAARFRGEIPWLIQCCAAV